MVSAVAEGGPVAADQDEQPALAEIERLLASSAGGVGLVGANGVRADIPDVVVRLLRQLVHVLARDQAVSIVPIDRQLTTQQAADLLNVSRSYLVRLLDDGTLPHTKTGAQRSVRLDDLLAYRRERDAQRRLALDRLTQLSDELGLYADE